MSPSNTLMHQEFAALVRRAARLGSLDAQDLLPTYAEMRPKGHPGMANPRCIDVDTMIDVIHQLPPKFLEARRIMVVADLDAFCCAERYATSLPSGSLDDGSLLIEAAEGSAALMQLAFFLCALQWERTKAQTLLAPQPDLMEKLFTALSSAPIDDESTRGDTAPDDAGLNAEDASDAAQAADANAAATESLSSLLSRLAFSLGLDEATLRAADEHTAGAFWQIVLVDEPVSALMLHAQLQPAAAHQHFLALSEQVIGIIAEMGMLGRPLHIWVGPPSLTDCLSPYSRDLHALLLQWAAEKPHEVGADARLNEAQPGEDLLYALAHDFLRTDQELVDERHKADGAVGIQHVVGHGLTFEVIDLARVERTVADSRLLDWQVGGEPPPVVLRLQNSAADGDGSILGGVLSALGAQVASVTLVLESHSERALEGSIVLPEQIELWSSAQRLRLNEVHGFDADAFAGYSDSPPLRGEVLLAPCEELLDTHGAKTVALGQEGIVSAVFEAQWRNALPATSPVAVAIVNTEYSETGRPTVQTLRALGAIAIAKLRSLFPPEPPKRPDPPQPPERGPAERPRTPSRAALAMRIKA